MLGANDGIVSTAGIVVGVAAATVARGPIMTAGIAGLAAGAVSMALGEYVSVSAQRDTEQALLRQERRELRADPSAELDELAGLYEAKGFVSGDRTHRRRGAHRSRSARRARRSGARFRSLGPDQPVAGCAVVGLGVQRWARCCR